MRRISRTRMAVTRSLMLVIAICLQLLPAYGVRSAEPSRTIVLIGGPKSHGFGEHDFPNGISLLKQFLDASPDARGAKIVAYPDGWPTEESGLEDASTLVLYFDGVQGGEDSHPLFNPAHRAQFEKLMLRGAGVVALHQASTVPANDTRIDLPHWLGGARYGMVDRTTELVEFKPVAHPISNGVGEFALNDEFYPTIRFLDDRKHVTAILTGRLHPQFRDGKPIVIDKAETLPVAWAFERDDGGRAFTFTGLHYLARLDDPPLRKLLLNAIFWTAKIEVPKDGVRTLAPADAAVRLVKSEMALASGPKITIEQAIVTPAADNKVIEYPWGHLTWYVSRELKNSDTMTIGEAVIKPGQENPRHYHPNCDEVLHVLKGRILNSMGDKSVVMNEGDTVSIPAGIRHNAKNIGTENAVLAISFSSADRQVVGE
jgi:quercetin dioxygenase-like cupin family protein/type 1 glutamine amidotransferase